MTEKPNSTQRRKSTKWVELDNQRDLSRIKDFSADQKERIIAKGNPPIDNNVIRGYN